MRGCRGAFVSGGVSFANDYQDSCGIIDNHEQERFCETNSGYRPDVKINGGYLLPPDVRVSGTYRGLAGPQIGGSWAVRNNLIAPALGRNLAAGATATKTVALIEPGTEYVSPTGLRHAFLEAGKIRPLPVPGECRSV